MIYFLGLTQLVARGSELHGRVLSSVIGRLSCGAAGCRRLRAARSCGVVCRRSAVVWRSWLPAAQSCTVEWYRLSSVVCRVTQLTVGGSELYCRVLTSVVWCRLSCDTAGCRRLRSAWSCGVGCRRSAVVRLAHAISFWCLGTAGSRHFGPGGVCVTRPPVDAADIADL